jgi:hypothetical protein
MELTSIGMYFLQIEINDKTQPRSINSSQAIHKIRHPSKSFSVPFTVIGQGTTADNEDAGSKM